MNNGLICIIKKCTTFKIMYYCASDDVNEGFNGRYKIIGMSKDKILYYCIPLDGQPETLDYSLHENGHWNMYVSNFFEI